MSACPIVSMMAILLLAACAGPDSVSTLDGDAKALKERIAAAQEERKSYGKGSVVHDLVTLRITIHEQTLAMLEQRLMAGRAQVALSYTVEGKPYRASNGAALDTARLEEKLKEARAAREHELQQGKEAGEPHRQLYAMSAATKAVQIAQLEYQLAASRHSFPPYYVPFHPLAEGAAPPQAITAPVGKDGVVR